MFSYSLVFCGVKSQEKTIEKNLICAFKIAKAFPNI